MPQIETVLTGYQSKNGTTPKGSWTMHIFKASDGTSFQTFDSALGNKAYDAKENGQSVRITFEVETRGEYTNNVIKAVELLGAASATSGVLAAQQGSPPPVHIQPLNPGAVAPSSPDDRQIQIMRQSALERAIRFYDLAGVKPENKAELYSVADEFVDYFVNGRKDEAKPTPAAESAPIGPSMDDVGF